MKNLKISKTGIIIILILVMYIAIGISLAVADQKPDLKELIKIEYLKPTHLNISSNGINRLHFSGARIIKIVGDSSQYKAILTENGSDLFFVSKVPSLEVIKLTLIEANSEAIDLRLHVTNSPEASIIKVDIAGKTRQERNEKKEISAMIGKMALGYQGKYFIQEKKRLIKVPTKPNLEMNQYVSYRFGDLVGAGFNYSNKVKVKGNGRKKGKNKKLPEQLVKEQLAKEQLAKEQLNKEELADIFKNILAISIVNDNPQAMETGKVFVVFKAGDDGDSDV